MTNGGWYGDQAILGAPLCGLLASTRIPPDLFLVTLERVRGEGLAGTVFISGFHSPLERECLNVLLEIHARVVCCPARSLRGMNLPRAWRTKIEAGELLVLSDLDGDQDRRTTVELARQRTASILARATRLLVPSAMVGSRTYSAAKEAIERDIPVYCFAHPKNRDLLLLGARAIHPEPLGFDLLEGGQSYRQND